MAPLLVGLWNGLDFSATTTESKNFVYWVMPIMAAQAVYLLTSFRQGTRARQVMLSLLGLYWCAVAMHVELTLADTYGHSFDHHHPPADMSAYTPFCDFAWWAKCSKVLMSPYGRVLQYSGLVSKEGPLDVPNPILGVGFYCCHLFYPALRAIRFPCLPFLGFATTVFVCAFSCWLGYTLFFVLNDFCVVCVSTYVCNFACLPVMYAILRTRDAPQNESFELDATINVVWVLLMLINAVLRLIQLPWRLLTAAYELLTRGQQDPPAEVVIVGASFAGLACFRELSGRRDCKVTLVDFKEYFEYTPGILRCFCDAAYLPELTCKLEATAPNARIVVAEMVGMSPTEVHLLHNPPPSDGGAGERSPAKKSPLRLKFDYLVLATGSTYNAPIKPLAAEPTLASRQGSWDRAAIDLKAARSVIIVGAGPVGLELAGEILTYFPEKAITFVDMAPRVLSGFDAGSVAHSERWLKQRNVTFRMGIAFEQINTDSVVLKGGEVLHADLVYPCIGVFPNTSFLKSTPLKAHMGFRDSIVVNDHLQVATMPKVYCCGDMMSHSSRELKLGHTAEINAHLASENIVRQMHGKPLLTYPDGVVGAPRSPKIFCLSLGRYDAILGFNGLVLSGFVAALMKWVLEWTKVSAAKQQPVGVLFWRVADTMSCFMARTILPTPAPP